jgi:hypothetical protein
MRAAAAPYDGRPRIPGGPTQNWPVRSYASKSTNIALGRMKADRGAKIPPHNRKKSYGLAGDTPSPIPTIASKCLDRWNQRMIISTRLFCRSRTPGPVGTSRCVSPNPWIVMAFGGTPSLTNSACTAVARRTDRP